MPRRSANGTAPALGTIGATLALVDALLGREAALVRARHRAVTLLLLLRRDHVGVLRLRDELALVRAGDDTHPTENSACMANFEFLGKTRFFARFSQRKEIFFGA